MNALVIYDSNFGNTKKVAETIAQELGDGTIAVSVNDLTPARLSGLQLLVVGSPINGWRPTKKIATFLAGLQHEVLQGCRVATFDTRVQLFIHGNAAKHLGELLQAAGGTVISKPQGFIVAGKTGPLKAGELDKAKAWAATLRVVT